MPVVFSSFTLGIFTTRMRRNMTAMTMPITTYGAIRIPRSLCLMASKSASGRAALSWELSGLSLAWMKFMATNIPHSEPIGLNDWAKLRRRVAVSSGPIARM